MVGPSLRTESQLAQSALCTGWETLIAPFGGSIGLELGRGRLTLLCTLFYSLSARVTLSHSGWRIQKDL